MKFKGINSTVFAAAITTLTSTTAIYNEATADDLQGFLLGFNGAGATDVHRVSCFDDGNGNTDHLFVTIRGINGDADDSITATGFKNNVAFATTDTNVTDNSFSPTIQVSGTNGNFLLFISHTKATNLQYFVVTHCEAADNSHTGTNITTPQNQ